MSQQPAAEHVPFQAIWVRAWVWGCFCAFLPPDVARCGLWHQLEIRGTNPRHSLLSQYFSIFVQRVALHIYVIYYGKTRPTFAHNSRMRNLYPDPSEPEAFWPTIPFRALAQSDIFQRLKTKATKKANAKN